MNNSGSGVAAQTTHQSGELARLVASALTGSGIGIRHSAYDDPCAFAITGLTDVGCQVVITGSGSLQLDWTPAAGPDTDPRVIADLAECLLTGAPAGAGRSRRAGGRGGLTFKGIVGQDLKARGLEVELEVFRDEATFEALTVIVAASPGGEDFSAVTVSDDGSLLWEHDYWSRYGEITPAAQCPALTRLGEIADDAARRISQAIFTATQTPGQEGGNSEHPAG